MKWTRDKIRKLKYKKGDLNYDEIWAIVAEKYVGRHGASAIMNRRGKTCGQCYKLYGPTTNHIKCLLPSD